MATIRDKKDVEQEVKRTIEYDGKKYEAIKDREYSMWSVKLGNKELPSRFTTFPKAILGVQEWASKQTKQVKQVA